MLLGSKRLQVMSDKGNQQVARCRTKIRMAVLYVSHRLSNFSELLPKGSTCPDMCSTGSKAPRCLTIHMSKRGVHLHMYSDASSYMMIMLE